MKSSQIAALFAAAALSLGLAACGGGGSDESSSSNPSTPQPPKTTADESTGNAGKGLTPPGTNLGLGQEATVAWVPFAEEDPTMAVDGLELKVTVESIEMKTLDDLEGLELEPDEEEETPYFVKLRLEALGGTEPPKDESPAIAFDAIDDRGQEQTSATIFGEFPDCEETDMPRPFTNGASYESCSIYLVHKGGAIQKVKWADGPSEPNEITPYYDDPIVWEGG
jgi:hypothetical protein